jgi:hypothetical protein
MLKIKDNYDLQQLTKYGFEETLTNVWVCETPVTYYDGYKDSLSIIVNWRDDKLNKYIQLSYESSNSYNGDIDILGDPTILYQMIMDGIVEAIE